MIEPTHQELVKIAACWLKRIMRCGVVFEEFTTAISEIPDALGLRSNYSILIECKVSRPDFLSDKSKSFRQYPETGIGDYRIYLCPPDIIQINDLPDRWGLLWYYPDTKEVKRIHIPIGNCWGDSGRDYKFEKSYLNEYRLMYSALRRIELRGDLQKIYDQAQ